MNLSVRRPKARRGGGGLGINFGLPMRVKRPLPALSEPGDELNGITELDCTVEVPQQNCELEAAPSNQIHGFHLARSSVHSASSSSQKDTGGEQNLPSACGSQKETSGELSEDCFRNNTVETQGIFAPQAPENLPYNKQPVGSHSFTTNPQPATLNNSSSRRQGDVSNSGHQPIYQIPTLQGLSSESNQGINSSVTIRQQSNNSNAQSTVTSGSLSQHSTARVNHSGPLRWMPGQLLGASHASGYPQEMQFSRPAAVPVQSSQETIMVKGKLYQRLGTIGKGGSSKVSFLVFVIIFFLRRVYAALSAALRPIFAFISNLDQACNSLFPLFLEWIVDFFVYNVSILDRQECTNCGQLPRFF